MLAVTAKAFRLTLQPRFFCGSAPVQMVLVFISPTFEEKNDIVASAV